MPKLAPLAKALGVDPNPLTPANLDALAQSDRPGEMERSLEQALGTASRTAS